MTMGSSGWLADLEQASALIESGATLAIAGDVELLASLPRGNWIGGSTPYFMAEEGGACRSDRVFIHQFDVGEGVIERYDRSSLPSFLVDAPENGFTLLILPAGSGVLEDYARYAPSYHDMFLKPVAGWVSGVRVDRLGKDAAQVVDGRTGECLTQAAIALHLALPEGSEAMVHAISLFEPGDGAEIEFPATGFSAGDCLVDGKPDKLANYMKAARIDHRLPLVADYSGAMVNVSIQEVDEASGEVAFYAPVFEGVRYRFARPIGDYPEQFLQAMPSEPGKVLFGCNCILNYLYSELEGRRTGDLTGPITFGEVAYQLLNQTAVYVTLEAM
ncbi:DUF6976 family protein [Marinobacter zhejiangensis]|uniref:Uncharacterized protein n=1 Tax=Marinobacter zhejiangensis TaxID=488535 RepID=A0A1I4KY59_9GAMM|nr:hypothetical protein [Marinobacter zhejiangensis]SFL83536.1 hypothetical protein SAMN04487963_0145 [Marinobacter zhejiangensis]